MTNRATGPLIRPGPIIDSKTFRRAFDNLADEIEESLRWDHQPGALDFFLLLPVTGDRIVTVLMRQHSPTTLRFELLAGSESKQPKRERNRDKKLKPVADVLLSPTGIKKVTMR
jgi:hypothetical protein